MGHSHNRFDYLEQDAFCSPMHARQKVELMQAVHLGGHSNIYYLFNLYKNLLHKI